MTGDGTALGRLRQALMDHGYRVHGTSAQCPGHDDQQESLSISQGRDGRALVKCHAGQPCDTGDILEALGMSPADLFADPPPQRARRGYQVTATYTYTDENGAALFYAERRDPKDFRQYRLEGGRKVWSLGTVRRVLYRLPEVIEAVAAGREVWIAEGEKDADALHAAGVVATCNPMGAGKWRSEYGELLKGVAVVIVSDRDEAGLKHARQVRDDLRGRAASVRVVQAAIDRPKADASDHLAAGLGLDAFLPVDEPAAQPAPAAEDPPKQTQAAVLVRLARERYRLITGDDGRPYAVAKDGPAIARPLRGRGGLREQLARVYTDTSRGAVASASAFTDATAVLEGHAGQAEPEPVYLRVAPHGGGVVLDLGTPDGRCIVAGPGGWRRERRSPVLFRRTALTMALPDPVRPAPGTPTLQVDDDGKPTGTLAPLACLLNTSEPTFRLLAGWLLAALLPGIPHPVLALLGEQGTAKSTAARLLTGLIDPSPAPLRSPPRDIRQWAVTASASWMVCLDNVSSIADWLSDSLCKAVTGDGIVDRALYTDDDVVVLAFRRVIALTSIDAGELRGDLGDRLLPAELDRIADTDRRADEAITADYEAARPELLGALLTLLCDCLARLPAVELPSLPRMADFGCLLAALDQVTGWATLSDYEASAADIAETVVESDLFAEAVRELVTGTASDGTWEGTAAALREHITPAKPPKWWPRTPRAASGRLRRCAPSLRRVGVEVTFTRQPGTGARIVTIACADMKCERPSHRHDRHGQDGRRGADQPEPPIGDCDGSDTALPSHQRQAEAGPTEPGRPTVTPSQCADLREPRAEPPGRDGSDGVTVDPTLNLEPNGSHVSPLSAGGGPDPTCDRCGERHRRYGDRGRPCRTSPSVEASR